MMTQYELEKAVRKIIDSNCEDIPYEGTEVDKETMTYEIVNFISSLNKC